MWPRAFVRRSGPALVAGAALAVALGAPAPGLAGPPELLERDKLRVCADSNNLPFTNAAGEGFENKIAEMMAEELGVRLSYTWAPQVMGFVRNTLDLRVCDIIIGMAAGNEFVQNTNAYYRSVYAFVLPPDAEVVPTSLTDERLRGMTIGAVSDTPPMVPLRRSGAAIEQYPLQVDTRAASPVRDAISDVAEGELDAAVLWGPMAGYFANRHDPPLNVVPLRGRDASNAKLDHRITMAIRRNEPMWKDWINDFIDRRQNDINRILVEYNVPLLDARGEPLDFAEMRDED